MQMIYGSVVRANTRELVETEKQNVARMMAALADCPWEAQAQRSLVGATGCCTLAIHASGDSSPRNLLPCIDGLTIAADVRLDNRAELCAELGLHAAEPEDRVDAELILRAYQRWGTDCARRFLGDFAFAIWDESAGRLFCARDFVGVRPFYYHHSPSDGSFVFASDLRAMAAHPGVPSQLDLTFVASVLKTGTGKFVHPEYTYYHSLKKLAPAHCLTVDANGLRCWAYWQPGKTSERRYADEQDYVEELLTLLQAAVACRVSSPQPVGAHISGGLDSSSVAVLAHRALLAQGRVVTGFSWSPPLPQDPSEMLPNDERKLVEAVRAAENLPIRYTSLTPAHILAHARRDITLQPTTTLQFELAASEDAARLGIRTMLSGWGGDELLAFNGRGYFSDLWRRGRWLTLQRELSQRARLHGGKVWRQWITDGIYPLIPTGILSRLRSDDSSAPRPLPGYLRPEFAAALSRVDPLTSSDAGERPGVRRMQIALLQHGHLSYRMESWASHGATLGLSYAFPLLDRRLVEFALSIPDYFFFKNGWKRYLYRTAMAGILPDSVRWQKIKEDPAMVKAATSTQKQAAAQLRGELLARSDNPYVDIGQLQSAMNAEKGIREAIVDDNLPQKERRALALQMTAGRGMWLAFVNIKMDKVKELAA